MCDKLALTEAIRERSCEIYKDYKDLKSLRGRKAIAFYAACIYIACRFESYPRTFKEINAAAPEASRKEIGRCFRLVLNEMQDTKGVSLDVGSIHPSDYMVCAEHIQQCHLMICLETFRIKIGIHTRRNAGVYSSGACCHAKGKGSLDLAFDRVCD